MPNLADLLSTGSVPEITYLDNPPDPLVEPLDGYATVDQVMDRFPEEVYNKSRDSHLYLFIQALGGDSGAGILKKQAYIARLKNEGALLVYKDLDTFYTQHFYFPRLPSEQYPGDVDPDSDILTKEEWNQITALDDRYRNRIKLFFNATRLGNSPDGMALAAEGGSGLHCDVWENYKAYYNLLSDDIQDIEYQGITNSPNEFVVLPRVRAEDGTADEDVTYTTDLNRTAATGYSYYTEWVASTTYAVNDVVSPTRWNGHLYRITAQTGNSGVTQPAFASNTEGQSFVQGNITYLDIGVVIDDYSYNADGDNSADADSDDSVHLLPEIESNMVHVLDTMRPVGALMTIQTANQHFMPITNDAGAAITPIAEATSSNFKMSRFVTGRVDVDWPVVDTIQGDRSNGYWIKPGEETEQQDFPLVARDHPVIWLTVDNVHAYTDEALFDPTYNTIDFYGGDVPLYPSYRSEHTGPSQGDFALIFPFVTRSPKDDVFSADKAIANQSSPLLLEGRPR